MLFSSLRSRAVSASRLPSSLLSPSSTRHLSTPPPPTAVSPPTLTPSLANQITKFTSLLSTHGVPSHNLAAISAMPHSSAPEVVKKWQSMMQSHLSAQLHVLAGLGYPNTEQGIGQYNMALATVMGGAAPDDAEEMRVGSRDLWRETLGRAFGFEPYPEGGGVLGGEELSIVEARELMFEVSNRMSSPDFLKVVSDELQSLSDISAKHTRIQELMISSVYAPPGSSLTEEYDASLGKGYAMMQCRIAEHQSDPLIAQYVGKAMMGVLKAGGMDEEAVRSQAGL